MMTNDKFFNVPLTTVSTSSGEVDLPVLYYKVTDLTFMFATDYQRVEEKLRPLGLKPGLRWGKKAVVACAFYQYHKTRRNPTSCQGMWGYPPLTRPTR